MKYQVTYKRFAKTESADGMENVVIRGNFNWCALEYARLFEKKSEKSTEFTNIYDLTFCQVIGEYEE